MQTGTKWFIRQLPIINHTSLLFYNFVLQCLIKYSKTVYVAGFKSTHDCKPRRIAQYISRRTKMGSYGWPVCGCLNVHAQSHNWATDMRIFPKASSRSLFVFLFGLNVAFLYCPFDISWKDVFCLAFSLKWKYFVLIDHILSETICLFWFCVLFSNTYPKIKFIAENWSDICNFYRTMIVFEFLSKKIFFNFLLLNLNYWYFTTILWKFQKNWTSRTCWKSAPKLPTLQISA